MANLVSFQLTLIITFASAYNLIMIGWIAFIVRQILYAHVSFKRIDDFLHREEELEKPEPINSSSDDLMEIIEQAPMYKDATLSWYAPESDSDNGFRLSNLNVRCVHEGLTVVSGPVGCGKSSFLLGLLGEMRTLGGEALLPRSQGVAYVAQTPWLQNATIRDNILFGSPFDEKRYKSVLESCALVSDIEMFEIGDLTEVGERGK